MAPFPPIQSKVFVICGTGRCRSDWEEVSSGAEESHSLLELLKHMILVFVAHEALE